MSAAETERLVAMLRVPRSVRDDLRAQLHDAHLTASSAGDHGLASLIFTWIDDLDAVAAVVSYRLRELDAEVWPWPDDLADLDDDGPAAAG